MRRRAWVLFGCLLPAILLGLVARHVEGADGWNLLAGLFFLAAILVAVSLLPLWSRILPDFAPMPGLFGRPGYAGRWCLSCGNVAPKRGPCPTCGGFPKGFDGVGLQRKPPPQTPGEKKGRA